MQLISKFNKEFRFLLCVIDTYSKCAWVISLRDKKGINIVNAFQKILNEDKNENQTKYGLIGLIGPKKFLLLVKLKIQCHGHMLLVILMANKLLVHFMKKNYKLQSNKNLELKK